MPRRKKLPAIPDYKGTGKVPESLLVQKTNPLMSLSETGLTLAEFKILDAYLARINSHDPDKRFIRLEKGEIERLLGVSQIKAGDLEKRIDNLFQTVTIRDKNLNNGFCKIALFERATCYQDDTGLWQVDLGASPSAMEYIFNPERLGYLRYSLRNVIKLTSRYSYVLFLYLEQNRHMHLRWEVALDELRTLLRCTADTYKAYYRFNELVLSKCCKELNEKTDCKFTYEPIKRGRTVKAIHFTLKTVADQLDGQISLADIAPAQPVDEDDKASTYSTELLGFLASACEFEFDDAEMRVLLDLILQLFPHSSNGGLERFNYLRRKYHLLLMYSDKKKISNRFGYLKSLIKADIKDHTS
ncbi:replication initiation protein [Acutalibacter muris]|jgi:plasmid replication initiation protein|uniref:replication initiation protein n=1 Tax=Acutalibacter muris TaxID=1796620 RepID=UPI0026F39D71|nr:replication initiation protein [Acutalibacter muris]